MGNFIGIDIGGTKCAITLALESGSGSVDFLDRRCFPTQAPKESISALFSLGEEMLRKFSSVKVDAIGISCGGPLDSKRGVVMSPPNLPKWDNVEIARIFSEHFKVPAFLQNDANAGALAEWKYGAGRGSSDMIFLTFGTGIGAGIIAGGKLIDGANGNAGEVGHISLEKQGPVGYGKRGSFEGFCSGCGISQLARCKALEILQRGGKCGYCETVEGLAKITAKSVAEAAEKGDEAAISVYEESGRYLGIGLSIIIDMLNPEKIVIGSIFSRAEKLLRTSMEKSIRKEALKSSADICEIVPSMLGEKIGDYAAIGTASSKF